MAEFASTRTAQGGFIERTIDTSLSQDAWPSAEGNDVCIHYRTSDSTDVHVSIYGETGKVEAELIAIRGKIVRGLSRRIRYQAAINDIDANMKSDSCTYSFEISQYRSMKCTGVTRSPVNANVQCESCMQELQVTLKLVQDVETLIAMCAH